MRPSFCSRLVWGIYFAKKAKILGMAHLCKPNNCILSTDASHVWSCFLYWFVVYVRCNLRLRTQNNLCYYSKMEASFPLRNTNGILPTIVCALFAIKNSGGLISIPNLVESLEAKYLKEISHSLALLCPSIVPKCRSLRKEFPCLKDTMVTLQLNPYLWKTNLSIDGYSKLLRENEPSITLCLPNDRTDFWSMFETALKLHSDCVNSDRAGNKGRLIIMIMWPERVNEDAIPGLVQHSIRTHAILEQYKSTLAMDGQNFILFPLKDSDHSKEDFRFYEIYFVKELLIVQKVVTSNSKSLIDFKSRRSDFRKVPLISVTQLDPRFPVSAQFTNESGSLALTGGTGLDVLRLLTWALNFTPYNILGKGWIGQGPHGTLTGMGEQLLNREADFVLSGSELIQYRLEKLSFTHPLHQNMLGAYFKKPRGISTHDIYFTTFKPSLWMTILVLWMVIGTVYSIFAKFNTNVMSHGQKQPHNHRILLSNIFFWCVSTTSQQGWNLTPSATSLRVIFLSGTYASVMVYAIFSSFIISKLSVEKDIFSSLKDLQREGFELYAQDVFVNAIAVVKNATGRTSDTSIILSYDEGLEKINTSKAAFVSSDTVFLSKEGDGSLCSFKSNVKVESERVWSGLYFRKADPIRKFFDNQFALWEERGLLRRMHVHYSRETIHVCDTNTREISLISLVDVTTAFIILGTGFSISTVFLTAEYRLYNYWVARIPGGFRTYLK